jgi:hypothetical protein
VTGPVSTAAPARRRRRWLWALLALVIVAWIAGVVVLAVRVDRHIRAGIAAVSTAQANTDAISISNPNSPDLLAPVSADFGAARRDLDNPLLWPVRWLPVAGRQIRAVRNLAAAAEQVGSIGQTAIDQARAALRAPHASGPQRVSAISALASAASTADARLSRVSLGSRTALIGFIRNHYDDFTTRLAKVRTGVHKGAVAAQQTAVLFRGPSHLLLLAGNNAEMRDGSGMFLSATQVDVVNGTVTIGTVSDTADLALPQSPVPLAPGYAAVWRPYLANEEWRNLGMSARFDETAAMAAAMWKAKTGHDVSGVMAIDIAGLQTLLVGTGPVQAAGMTVTPQNVTQLLMHDQYVGLTGDASNASRRDELGRIAASVVQAVQRGGFDTAAVAKQMPATVGGRHLLLWSADPTTEAGWQAAGVGGVLGSDTLLAAVQNVGVNKLDQFLSVSTAVKVAPGPSTAVTATLDLVNHTPPGEPGYIAGTRIAGVPPDTYLALATLTMPGSAGDVLVDGKPLANNAGFDGPTRVVAVLRPVAPGADVHVTVTFTLPGPHGRLQIESAARLPSATVSVATPSAVTSNADDKRPSASW